MSHLARSVDAHKTLAHPVRQRLVAMLRRGDLCVCQMTAVLERAASTVSAHLPDLKRAGLFGFTFHIDSEHLEKRVDGHEVESPHHIHAPTDETWDGHDFTI